MDEVLAVIEEALKKRGMHAATASKLAVGNSALLKNMMNARGEPRYSYQNLKRLAQVLGLELYFGPPRVGVLQEQAAPFSVETPLDIRWIPLDPRQAQLLTDPPALDRLAVPRDWLRAQGIAINSATLILATDDAMAPAIGQGATAIVDTADTDMDDTGAVRAVMIGAAVKLRRIEQGLDWIIARPDNPRAPIDSISRRHAGTMTILGRVRAVISTVD